MYANVPNGVHSGGESMARTVDMVQHVDIRDRRHSLRGRKHQLTMAVERSDCLHRVQGFAFSIWFVDFGTKFSP